MRRKELLSAMREAKLAQRRIGCQGQQSIIQRSLNEIISQLTRMPYSDWSNVAFDGHIFLNNDGCP